MENIIRNIDIYRRELTKARKTVRDYEKLLKAELAKLEAAQEAQPDNG